MTVDAGVFVGHCHVCLSNRPCRVSNHVPSGQFEQTLQPSEVVVADPVGPLPTTPEGYCYLLVLVDCASRWIEAFPMRGNTAEFILAAFLLFIWRRGCPRILYTDRGGNLLSFLAHKVYQRLGVTKGSGSSHRHNTSGMCERTIQSVLTMLTCDMAGEQHHVTWHDRVPPILWSLNTSPSAATGYSPFYLEHGREPRDVTSRAFDTSDVPAASLKWVQVMNQRLEMARKVHSAVDTHAKDTQQRRTELPAQARREPKPLLPGSHCYYQVQRFTRASADGMKFVPGWSGPYLVRSTVPGSQHRYLIARSETSATFDAHITRLRASPHKTFGVVALESRVSDAQGAGRGFHEMDPSIVFEIDRILDVNDKEVLLSFMGNEMNARWVPRADMTAQGLNDLIADYMDSSGATMISATATCGPRFTMSQTAVARLENKRTHDAFNRKYHSGKWLDLCPTCSKEGVKGNPLLMCDFCPNAFHFGCLGLEVRQRAQKGDWQCPPCRQLDDLTRLDERPRKKPRLPADRPGLEPAIPTLSNTKIEAPITLPRTTDQPMAAHAPPVPARRPVGRPRKVVRLNDGAPTIIPTGPQRTDAVEPEQVTVAASDLPPPRSRTTRNGTAAHGVTPTPALPMTARMNLLQDRAPTTHDRERRRVTLTTALDSDHQDRDEAADRPRRC